MKNLDSLLPTETPPETASLTSMSYHYEIPVDKSKLTSMAINTLSKEMLMVTSKDVSIFSI